MDDRDAQELPSQRGVFRPRVLLISNDSEVISLIQQLSEKGVEAEVAQSLEELERCATRDGPPNVVFLDLDLVEGAEDALVPFVQRSFPLASVVALGGELGGERAARLLTAGVPSLSKPMSADALAGVALRFSLEARVSTGTGHTSEAPAPGREGVGRLEALLESYATDRALSGQQRIVLKLYLAGKNDKEIASECSCSEATVYEHWRRMARKAGGMHKGCVIADFHRFLDQL